MIKAGIIGVSGFSGFELLKILLRHPHVDVTYLSGSRSVGSRLSQLFPQLTGLFNGAVEDIDPVSVSGLDVLFLCLPHRESMGALRGLGADNVKVIDLSADFRLPVSVYEKWYGCRHLMPDKVSEAVYGLCECNRAFIEQASFIANPGCYSTAALLGIVPLLEEIEVDSIIVDAKSGVSGAGRSGDPSLQFCEVNENFKAYSVFTHRHTPEMEEFLSARCGREVRIVFSAHLLPVQRGILSTVYVKLKRKLDWNDIFYLYSSYYEEAAFVRVRETLPEVKDVKGTNFCDVGFVVDDRTGVVAIVSVIDNLIKGASGQAVQNMNLMFGFDEKDGLLPYPFYP